MYSHLTPPVGQDCVEINSQGPGCMCDQLFRGDEFTAVYVSDGSLAAGEQTQLKVS